MSPPVLDVPSPSTNALVIGSLATASDGSYQSVISSVQGAEVERQLVDRILDNGKRAIDRDWPMRADSSHIQLQACLLAGTRRSTLFWAAANTQRSEHRSPRCCRPFTSPCRQMALFTYATSHLAPTTLPLLASRSCRHKMRPN